MRPQDLAREQACFEILRRLPRAGVVLIGGYAVSAFGPTRFSVDLDLVTTPYGASAVRELLTREGFVHEGTWEGGGSFADRSERWSRGASGSSISVDLLIGGVSDRRSGATFSYRDLRSRAVPRRIHGQDPTSEAEALVVDREALISLKLAVGRLVDLRDVAMLASEASDEDAIMTLLRRAPMGIVRANIERLLAALETREFRDSLKGVYMLDDRAYERIVLGTRRVASQLLSRIQALNEGGKPMESR